PDPAVRERERIQPGHRVLAVVALGLEWDELPARRPAPADVLDHDRVAVARVPGRMRVAQVLALALVIGQPDEQHRVLAAAARTPDVGVQHRAVSHPGLERLIDERVVGGGALRLHRMPCSLNTARRLAPLRRMSRITSSPETFSNARRTTSSSRSAGTTTQP